PRAFAVAGAGAGGAPPLHPARMQSAIELRRNPPMSPPRPLASKPRSTCSPPRKGRWCRRHPMRLGVSISAFFLSGLLACERNRPAPPPVSEMAHDAASAVSAALRMDAGTGQAPAEPSAVAPAPARAAPSTSGPVMRYRLGPLLRFHLVPVGAAAVGPARAALPALRQRYGGFAFDLGATLTSLPSTAIDCTAFLGTLIGARGTLFVVSAPMPCPSPFGAVDPRISAAVVPLASLGKAGSPDASRRLEALLGADVGELLGLSFPCTGGKACCPLRTAADLSVFDARMAVSDCPQHAGELGRIRTDAGLE